MSSSAMWYERESQIGNSDAKYVSTNGARTVTLSWPRTVSTPALLPGIILGVVLLVAAAATIFGALDSVGPGSGLVLLAPHDPVPLLAQVEQRWPGRFTLEYLERGPVDWRLAFLG